jgi:hypothetical protein
MANWSNPLLTSTYTNFVTEVKDRDTDLALQFDGTTSSNIPTNAIRWNSSVNRWQKWNGSAWGELTSLYALTGLSTTGNATIAGTLGSGAFTSTGAVSGTAFLPSGSSVPTNGLYLPSANTLGFATASTLRLAIESTGRVGIGTNSPSTALQVSNAAGGASVGNIYIAPSTAGQARYHLFNGGGIAEWAFGQKTSTDHTFKLSKIVAGSESDYLTVLTDGNVGIGTTSPAVRLQVAGQITATGGLYALRASNGSGTSAASIALERIGAATDQKYWEILHDNTNNYIIRTVNDTYSAAQDALRLIRGSGYTVDNIQLLTQGNTRLNITSAGNVGIGTTSPSALLHVAGDARVGANNTTDARLAIGEGASGNRFAYIDLVGDTTYSTYGLRLIRWNSGANSNSLLEHRGTGGLYISCAEAGSISFQTSSTARAYFSGSSFNLTNGTDIRTDTNTGVTTLWGGAGTGANIELYGGSHASFANLMALDAGEIRMRSQTGASEWLRITSTGRVGIGTGSPSTALQVSNAAGSATTGNVYVAPSTAGQARYHLYNGGSVAEWLFGQKTSTDHDFKLSQQVAGVETDYLAVTTSGVFKFNSGYGSAGNAYGCRAWANIYAGATPSIRSSGNVSSVTDAGAGTGDFLVSFTTSMPDADYAAVVTAGGSGTLASANAAVGWAAVYAVGSVRIGISDNNTDTNIDTDYLNVAVFR